MSHICIIEDDAAIAEIERDYLEINGFTVSIATDGVSGLNLTQTESFDLILLDFIQRISLLFFTNKFTKLFHTTGKGFA